MIAAAVADLASRPGQRWYDDQLELLRHVAAVAEGSGFGPWRQDAVHVLAEAADLLGPVADAVAGAPSAAWWWQSADRVAQRWLGCAHHPVLARGPALMRLVRVAAEGDREPDPGTLPWPAPEGAY